MGKWQDYVIGEQLMEKLDVMGLLHDHHDVELVFLVDGEEIAKIDEPFEKIDVPNSPLPPAEPALLIDQGEEKGPVQAAVARGRSQPIAEHPDSVAWLTDKPPKGGTSVQDGIPETPARRCIAG